jgi:hypothetical protein
MDRICPEHRDRRRFAMNVCGYSGSIRAGSLHRGRMRASSGPRRVVADVVAHAVECMGGVVILSWAFGLCRHASQELLDFRRGGANEAKIRTALENLGDVHVRDLHVWSLGHDRLGCIVTLASPTPRESATYRSLILENCPIIHLTIEVESFH